MTYYYLSNFSIGCPVVECQRWRHGALINKNEIPVMVRVQLIEQLNAATKNQLFQFNGNLYEQTDGVAMGSPLWSSSRQRVYVLH